MQTITYGGYYNLMARQLTLSASFLKNRIRSGPMSAFTTLFAVFTVVFAFLVGADVNFELLSNSLTFECRKTRNFQGLIRPEFSYYGEEEGEEIVSN